MWDCYTHANVWTQVWHVPQFLLSSGPGRFSCHVLTDRKGGKRRTENTSCVLSLLPWIWNEQTTDNGPTASFSLFFWFLVGLNLWLDSVPLRPNVSCLRFQIVWNLVGSFGRNVFSCQYKRCKIVSKLLMKNVDSSRVLTDSLPPGPRWVVSAEHTEELSSISRFYVVKCFN